MKEYGISASFSMIENADGVQAGMHFADTEDLDIDVSVEGENREEVLQSLVQEVAEETMMQALTASEEVEPEPEMTFEALQEENAQLRDEIEFLRERLDEAWDELSVEKYVENDKDSLLDNVSDEKGNQNTDDYSWFKDLDIDPKALDLFFKMFN